MARGGSWHRVRLVSVLVSIWSAYAHPTAHMNVDPLPFGTPSLTAAFPLADSRVNSYRPSRISSGIFVLGMTMLMRGCTERGTEREDAVLRGGAGGGSTLKLDVVADVRPAVRSSIL